MVEVPQPETRRLATIMFTDIVGSKPTTRIRRTPSRFTSASAFTWVTSCKKMVTWLATG